MEPLLDHVVVDVQHRIAEAARRYTALGFRLTELGRHSLGTVNRLAMFGSDYLELLGSGEPGRPVRPDVAGFPAGLNGLVFKMHGAAQAHAELQRRGVPVEPVQSFSRPVDIAGRREEARFHTVRLPPRTVFDGRVYFCEHLTPQFVWRPEWLDHPNGALALARIVIAARNPAQVGAWFPRLLGGPGPEEEVPGQLALRLGPVRIDIVPHGHLPREVGDALPEAAGRADYMALLGIRVRSLARTEQALRGGGVDRIGKAPGKLRVHPAEAMNVVLEFSE